jgi:hypothetical protein
MSIIFNIYYFMADENDGRISTRPPTAAGAQPIFRPVIRARAKRSLPICLDHTTPKSIYIYLFCL